MEDYCIPVPDDLKSIRAIHDGSRWVKGIIPGSVKVSHGILTFVCDWHGTKRRFTVSTDIVGGYQCE